MTAYEVFSGEIHPGISTAYVVPVIPDDAPATVREGITRRRLATINGRCPCGATRPPMPRAVRRRLQRHQAPPEAYDASIVHEDDCPAVHPDTLAWLNGWRRISR